MQENLEKAERLIELSLKEGGDVGRFFSPYHKALGIVSKIAVNAGLREKAGDSIDINRLYDNVHKIFSEVENLPTYTDHKNHGVVELPEGNINGEKFIICDTKNPHFALAYVLDNDIYILDSLPDHTQWSFDRKEFKIHRLPVPYQDQNDCAINTLVNSLFVKDILKIYKDSGLSDEEIEEIKKMKINILVAKKMIEILRLKENSDLTTKFDSLIDLYPTAVSIVIETIENFEKTKNIKKTIDFLKEYIEIEEVKLKSLKEVILSKEKEVQYERMKEDFGLFKTIDSKRFLKTGLDKKIEELKEETKEIKEIEKKIKTLDPELANDILANIEMATKVNSKYMSREMARRKALEETKEMLRL